MLFEPSFEGLGGNVRTPSIAHCKAHGRFPIRYNWTLFTISYGCDVISGNLSNLAFIEGEWVTLSANFRRKGASPTLLVSEN